jgi:hypothetical protein
MRESERKGRERKEGETAEILGERKEDIGKQ